MHVLRMSEIPLTTLWRWQPTQSDYTEHLERNKTKEQARAVGWGGRNYAWTFSSISLESIATFKFLKAKKLLRIKDEGTDAV